MRSFSLFCLLIMTLFFGSAAQARTITLNPDDTLVLRGRVTSESVAKIIDKIVSSPREHFFFYITSPGGSIYAGNNLIAAMHSSGKTFTCIASTAASMAFGILQACDERLVTENSLVMQHVASYSLEGEAPNNHSYASLIERMVEQMDAQQADRIGMSLENFKKKIRDDWWLYDGEAVGAGVADGTVQAQCSTTLAKLRVEENFETLFGTIRLTWSGCPLVEYPLKVSFQGNYSVPEPDKQFDDFMFWYRARDYLLMGKYLPGKMRNSVNTLSDLDW